MVSKTNRERFGGDCELPYQRQISLLILYPQYHRAPRPGAIQVRAGARISWAPGSLPHTKPWHGTEPGSPHGKLTEEIALVASIAPKCLGSGPCFHAGSSLTLFLPDFSTAVVESSPPLYCSLRSAQLSLAMEQTWVVRKTAHSRFLEPYLQTCLLPTWQRYIQDGEILQGRASFMALEFYNRTRIVPPTPTR